MPNHWVPTTAEIPRPDIPAEIPAQPFCMYANQWKVVQVITAQ